MDINGSRLIHEDPCCNNNANAMDFENSTFKNLKLDFDNESKWGAVHKESHVDGANPYNLEETCINNLNDTIGSSSISEFYSNTTILVTGGTGFLGKVLIEKILRSCGSVRTVFVLLRAKKGRSSEERYEDFIQNKIFDRIRAKNADQLRKLVCVAGDISLPFLGLSPDDRTKIQETVNVVLHSAATVRFDQPLKDAVNLNTMGSQRLFQLCTDMKSLKSFVHVSTAFCNPMRQQVDEKVYSPQNRMDIETFMKCAETLPSELLSRIALHLQGFHPNTYTVTKAMGEQIAADYHHLLPICIVRPSIVTAAVNEPYPGWVDNVNGITGIMTEIGRGTITSIMCDERMVLDVIPVDIVCNMIIAAAWHNYNSPVNSIRVYNCTSGQMNPIRWHEYGRITLKYVREFPSKYVMLYPNFTYRTWRFVHAFYEIFYHFLPAFLYDVVMRVKGMRPICYTIAKRYKMAADTGEFFAMHEYNFDTTNVRQLQQKVNAAKDGTEFDINIEAIDWDAYIRQYILGIRKYVLKDDIASLAPARSKVFRYFVVKCCLQMFVAWILYTIVSKYWL